MGLLVKQDLSKPRLIKVFFCKPGCGSGVRVFLKKKNLKLVPLTFQFPSCERLQNVRLSAGLFTCINYEWMWSVLPQHIPCVCPPPSPTLMGTSISDDACGGVPGKVRCFPQNYAWLCCRGLLLFKPDTTLPRECSQKAGLTDELLGLQVLGSHS